jgi:hypothetical protein
MAAKADIIVDQGTTFNITLYLTNNAGQPLDLTGNSVKAQIRKWYTSTTSIDFTSTILSPSTNGVIELSLNANTTAGMSFGRYVYDVITTDSGGTVTRVVEGQLTVTPEVTHIVGVTYGN